MGNGYSTDVLGSRHQHVDRSASSHWKRFVDSLFGAQSVASSFHYHEVDVALCSQLASRPRPEQHDPLRIDLFSDGGYYGHQFFFVGFPVAPELPLLESPPLGRVSFSFRSPNPWLHSCHSTPPAALARCRGGTRRAVAPCPVFEFISSAPTADSSLALRADQVSDSSPSVRGGPLEISARIAVSRVHPRSGGVVVAAIPVTRSRSVDPARRIPLANRAATTD